MYFGSQSFSGEGGVDSLNPHVKLLTNEVEWYLEKRMEWFSSFFGRNVYVYVWEEEVMRIMRTIWRQRGNSKLPPEFLRGAWMDLM